MNVFVVGTGRCGTVTFSKACRHITNYTSGHETRAGTYDHRHLDYPANHIEVDPHLAWMLGLLVEKYPEALYIHLQRHRHDVVESWFRRGIQVHSGAAPLIDVLCQTCAGRLAPDEYRRALGYLYDLVNANIRQTVGKHVRSMHIWLHESKERFGNFWSLIGGQGNREAAIAEFDTRYNACG